MAGTTTFKRTRTSSKGKKITETVTRKAGIGRGLHPNSISNLKKYHFKPKVADVEPHVKEATNPNTKWANKIVHKKGAVRPPGMTNVSVGYEKQQRDKKKNSTSASTSVTAKVNKSTANKTAHSKKPNPRPQSPSKPKMPKKMRSHKHFGNIRKAVRKVADAFS